MNKAIIAIATTALLSACAANNDATHGKTVGCQEFSKKAQGMSEEATMKQAQALGISVRVVEKDGQPYKTTHDYQPERLNIGINNGLVSRAFCG